MTSLGIELLSMIDDRVAQAVFSGRVPTRADLAVLNIEIEAGEWMSLFQRDPNARARMRIARRIGSPFSEIADRWSTKDLAAELGWDAMEVVEQLDRCPTCSIAESDLYDARGRPLKYPRFVLEEGGCRACTERKSWSDDDPKGEYRWRARRPSDGALDGRGGFLVAGDGGRRTGGTPQAKKSSGYSG